MSRHPKTDEEKPQLPPKRKDWPKWNNLCYIWSLCERLWSLFCVLGCFVVTVELQFFIWSHNFLWLLEISNSKNFQTLDKKTKSNTRNKIRLHKVIHNLQLMSHLWIVQKTELSLKPKITSSRKNAYFEKRLKNLPRKQDVFTVLMLLYKMNN